MSVKFASNLLRTRLVRVGVLLAITCALAGCTPTAPDVDNTNPTDVVAAQTIAAGTVVIAGEPSKAIDGTIGVSKGCVVIFDPDTNEPRVAIWPVGTQLDGSDNEIVRLANGEVSIGDAIEPSRGYIMKNKAFQELLDVEGNVVSGWTECKSVNDEVVVVAYVKDFAQQE